MVHNDRSSGRAWIRLRGLDNGPHQSFRKDRVEQRRCGCSEHVHRLGDALVHDDVIGMPVEAVGAEGDDHIGPDVPEREDDLVAEQRLIHAVRDPSG